MTHRNRVWRGIGVALVALAFAARIGSDDGTHTELGVAAFLLCLAGLVLIVQGKRVPVALRVEFSRHRLLADAIRDRRRKPPTDPKD